MNAPQRVGELDRQKYLGGSDAAAIMGLSPWKTRLDLYLSKVDGEAQESAARKLFFKRRKRQEPVVAEILTEEFGIDLIRLSTDGEPNRYVDPQHSFLAAEIDFEFRMNDAAKEWLPAFSGIANGEICNGEIKTVHPFKSHEWGEEGSEEVPIYYAAQSMHGLGVTRRPACLVAALFGVDQLVGFPVMRDEETIAGMRSQEVAFWNDHVLARVAPEPSNMEDIKRLFSKARGTPVELTAEIAEEARKVQRIRETIKAFEIEQEAAEFRVARFIAERWGFADPRATEDNASLLIDGVEVATWKKQRGAYLDQRSLKEKHPDITRAFTKETSFRVLRLKK